MLLSNYLTTIRSQIRLRTVKDLRSYLLILCFISLASSPAAADRNLYQFDTGLQLGGAELFGPWWNALQRNTLQRVQFDLCIARIESCSRRQKALRALVLRGRDLSIKDRLELVNRYLNKRDYDNDSGFNNADTVAEDSRGNSQNDERTRRVRSHWSTLFEFLKRGGDCEDYASSKYFLLRMLGIEPERMRVVVAKQPKQRGHHAVLAYHWENGDVWLLESDNVIKKRSHFGYRYVYALNEAGVWDYRTNPSDWNN